LRLKIEPYAQFLYDVPVIPDSNFSVLNMEADWYFNEELINTDTGYNTGGLYYNYKTGKVERFEFAVPVIT